MDSDLARNEYLCLGAGAASAANGLPEINDLRGHSRLKPLPQGPTLSFATPSLSAKVFAAEAAPTAASARVGGKAIMHGDAIGDQGHPQTAHGLGQLGGDDALAGAEFQ